MGIGTRAVRDGIEFILAVLNVDVDGFVVRVAPRFNTYLHQATNDAGTRSIADGCSQPAAIIFNTGFESALGAGCRRFKSCRPDQLNQQLTAVDRPDVKPKRRDPDCPAVLGFHTIGDEIRSFAIFRFAIVRSCWTSADSVLR